jgi:hypothetical protein
VASNRCCSSEDRLGVPQLGHDLGLLLVQAGVVDGDGGHVGQCHHPVHVLLAEP